MEPLSALPYFVFETRVTAWGRKLKPDFAPFDPPPCKNWGSDGRNVLVGI